MTDSQIDAQLAGGAKPVRSEFADDPDYAELLELFVEGIAEHRQTIGALYGAGQIDALRSRAHQLKGAGGGYGFPGLSVAASALEQECDSGQPDAQKRALDALLDYLARIAG